MRLALCALLVCSGLGCSVGSADGGTGLLAGKTSHDSQGVLHAARLTDGLVPDEGSAWNSNRTTVFETIGSRIDYDLGDLVAIDSAKLLGDNNDEYELLISDDGKHFRRLWLARRHPEPGLRWRQVSDLDAKARYVRLVARTGDRALGVAELSLHTEPSSGFGMFKKVSADDLNLQTRTALLLFATAAIVAVALSGSAAGWLWNLVMLGLLLVSAGNLLRVFLEAYPVEQLEVSLARGVAAIVALAVVARETYSRRSAPFRGTSLLALTLAAILGVSAFFNLGNPQFYDHENREPSVVHNFDMRVYFPVAKYFQELKYDGLYLASVLSYAEEHGGLKSRRIQETELRDLRDHRMRKVRDVEPEVEAIRARFSDARWEEFKRDMSYFWKTMGTGGYLGSMRDHGGNATPVWLTIAYAMFKDAPASNEILLLGGALDPLLLLIFALAVWRTFGVRTALVSLVVFGANDFYMFGSNWAGATLRNDWMVYLGLGACALHVGRYRLGGALLAFSALIRAFPAISLLALGIPVGYYLVGFAKEHGRLPTFKRFLKEQRWFFETALGATLFVAVAVGISSLVLGADCWPLWVKKISSFTASPHVNHVSLLTVTSGSEGNQHAVQLSRLPLHLGATALYLGLTVWACYRKPPHVAALLGILLMPVLMYPANYYSHFVFLLPLLASEPLAPRESRFFREADGKVWMLVLGLCAAQYFTVRETALDMHFYNASVLLMAATAGILLFLLPRSADGLILVPFLDTPARDALLTFGPGGHEEQLEEQDDEAVDSSEGEEESEAAGVDDEDDEEESEAAGVHDEEESEAAGVDDEGEVDESGTSPEKKDVT